MARSAIMFVHMICAIQYHHSYSSEMATFVFHQIAQNFEVANGVIDTTMLRTFLECAGICANSPECVVFSTKCTLGLHLTTICRCVLSSTDPTLPVSITNRFLLPAAGYNTFSGNLSQ